ncbi:hypothetical protein ACP4OV_014617 [Aristida adscensionis]
MVDVQGVVKSWFVMLKEDTYVLIRIEFLVALVTVMFLALFIMDFYRYQTRSSAINTIIKTVDDLSDRIVLYLIGAMQSADFYNQLFPVWAVVLVSLRASLGYLSGYSIVDRERRITEISNVIKFVGTGVLNGTRALEFTKPLWSLWAILTLRSIYRFWAHGKAVESLWHGRSSEFLPEHLRQDTEKYLVYGETNKKLEIERPQYTLHLDVSNSNSGSLITLDKSWGCSGELLRSSYKYNDMSLAFFLSRLLRCRLEDVPLHSESISSTRDLIIQKVIADQRAEPEAEPTEIVSDQRAEPTEIVADQRSEPTAIVADHHVEPEAEQAEVVGEQCAEETRAAQAFRILELELAFVRDYFYTLYPMVFWRGLGSLYLSLLQSITTFAVAFWLAVDIRDVYGLPQEENFALWVHGCNVDVIITWVFMFFMMFKEVWEMVTYLLSNWTLVLLVCKYVRNQCWLLGKACLTERMTASFFTSKIADPWHGRIDQYDFLQSCTYSPTFWKFAHIATLGKTPEKLNGRKPGDAINIPQCVKVRVLQELRRLNLNNDQLCRDIPSFTNPNISFQRYSWTWSELHICSHVILVWHIATSLCEIKLAQDKNMDLSKPSFLWSVWSCLKKRLCCSSQPFLIGENISLEGRLKTNYLITNSLSRYCAYLLVSRPELLPDSFIVPDVIFEKTLDSARKKLKYCNLTGCRYNTLRTLVQELMAHDVENGEQRTDILQQGAMLAEDLISKENEQDRWEILAGVWTKLLVHIAPSWNAEAHKRNLESGGEFITLIWALLWHCGIDKSDMWNESSNAQAPRGNNTETSNTRVADEQYNPDGENGIVDEAETSSLRTRQRRNARADRQEEQAQVESVARNVVVPLSTSTN